ncbi:unnamed protein product, partial [Nesidiocoris tenuis]
MKYCRRRDAIIWRRREPQHLAVVQVDYRSVKTIKNPLNQSEAILHPRFLPITGKTSTLINQARRPSRTRHVLTR